MTNRCQIPAEASARSSRPSTGHAMVDPAIASLHTVFVIIYLQESAWICAPLLISANVFLHACMSNVRKSKNLGWLLLSGGVFGFFLLTGISLAVSLYLAHSKALCQKKPRFFLPYIVTKVIRIAALCTVSLIILLTPELIMIYFYASVYGLFECAAGAVALEVTFRSWRVVRKSAGGRRRQSSSDGPTLGVSKQTLVMSNAE